MTILRWYVGMLERILGLIWDTAAGWRCESCGWRSPNFVFYCQECGSSRFRE